MSLVGQTRHFRHVCGMSGYPLIATEQRTFRNRRSVPIATDAPQQTATLFDHVVGAGEQRGRHREAERLGGGQVDHEIELGRLLDRDIGRLGPAQNLVDIVGGADTMQLRARRCRPGLEPTGQIVPLPLLRS
jgi:hypothetical protein